MPPSLPKSNENFPNESPEIVNEMASSAETHSNEENKIENKVDNRSSQKYKRKTAYSKKATTKNDEKSCKELPSTGVVSRFGRQIKSNKRTDFIYYK